MMSTTDPISGADIRDPTCHPLVVEDDHYHDITIYFESEATRDACLAIPVERHGLDISVSLDNPTDDYPDVN
jgi:hypothetical protein